MKTAIPLATFISIAAVAASPVALKPGPVVTTSNIEGLSIPSPNLLSRKEEAFAEIARRFFSGDVLVARTPRGGDGNAAADNAADATAADAAAADTAAAGNGKADKKAKAQAAAAAADQAAAAANGTAAAVSLQ